jgi:hypothetical protein
MTARGVGRCFDQSRATAVCSVPMGLFHVRRSRPTPRAATHGAAIPNKSGTTRACLSQPLDGCHAGKGRWQRWPGRRQSLPSLVEMLPRRRLAGPYAGNPLSMSASIFIEDAAHLFDRRRGSLGRVSRALRSPTPRVPAECDGRIESLYAALAVQGRALISWSQFSRLRVENWPIACQALTRGSATS